MKVICVDNFHRLEIPDQLIMERLSMENAQRLVILMSSFVADSDERHYRAVPDHYALNPGLDS